MENNFIHLIFIFTINKIIIILNKFFNTKQNIYMIVNIHVYIYFNEFVNKEAQRKCLKSKKNNQNALWI